MKVKLRLIQYNCVVYGANPGEINFQLARVRISMNYSGTDLGGGHQSVMPFLSGAPPPKRYPGSATDYLGFG